MNKTYEEESDLQAKRDVAWLKSVATDICKINPYSSEFHDFCYLWDNRDKIVRNKKLIDILE